MLRHWRKFFLASLVGVGLLLTPGISEAQRGGRGGRGYDGGRGYGGRGYDGRGYGGRGFYGPGVGFGIGFGYPGYYGYGSGYGYSGYGDGYGGSYVYPGTSTYSYYPDSSVFTDGAQPSYSGSSNTMRNPNDAGFTVRRSGPQRRGLVSRPSDATARDGPPV